MRLKVVSTILIALAFLCQCSRKPEEAAKEKYFQGVNLVKEKKYAEAVEVFKQVRERYPETEWGRKATKDVDFYQDVMQIDKYTEQRQVRADFRDIYRACEMFRANANRYPDSVQDLMPQYLKKVMKDPWGKDYYYAVETRGGKQSVVIACFGEDQIPGGDDDAVDIILEKDRFTAGNDETNPIQ